MKVLIQRILNAQVEIENKVFSSINKGLLIYICFEAEDKLESIDKAVDKILALRIFEDNKGKMNQSILEKKLSILSVSQFTLSWNGMGGNRPSFTNSMEPTKAKAFYLHFNDKLRANAVDIKPGIFGAEMKVNSTNDGPVTFFLSF